MYLTYLASTVTDADANARAAALGVPGVSAFAPGGVPTAYASAPPPCVIVDSAYAPSGPVLLLEPTTATAVQQAAAAILQAETAGTASALTLASTHGANHDLLFQKARTALGNNASYLANPSVTQAQAVQQVSALTRQVNALIKVTIASLDDVLGT